MNDLTRRQVMRFGGMTFFSLSVGGCLDTKLGEFELPPVPGVTDMAGWPMRGLKSEDLKRQKAMVVVFASWCPYCQAQHPVLMKFADRLHGPLYGILSQDKADAGARYLGRAGNPYRAVGFDPDGKIARQMGGTGVPNNIVFSKDMKMLAQMMGGLDERLFLDRMVSKMNSA